MNDLRSMIKDIQRHCGAFPDGVFGPLTAAAVLRELRGEAYQMPAVPHVVDGLDPRTLENIATLDAGCVAGFAHFTRLAKATAATFGCDYVMISGNRDMAEQAALYAQGRTAPGKRVTNAKPGYSWHNFKVAADFGVFRAGDYLDNTEPTLAAKVHAACSVHAKACGLEWGGNWAKFKDTPHYQVAGLGSAPTAASRATFKEKGSVL
jgi:peptidoglycan L-alanyl-D-glutamate endopeptidase CwlK